MIFYGYANDCCVTLLFQLAKQFGFKYETELDGECILHLYAKGRHIKKDWGRSRNQHKGARTSPQPYTLALFCGINVSSQTVKKPFLLYSVQ